MKQTGKSARSGGKFPLALTQLISYGNILTLYDVGRTDGVSYAVMELLEGETLRARLASGALPPRKAVAIAAQIARGLAAAHEKHTAHRDLKLENVFIGSDGSVKILDFGLARQTADSTAAASEAATLGAATEAMSAHQGFNGITVRADST
jgi:serine/threonine-protein kinase